MDDMNFASLVYAVLIMMGGVSAGCHRPSAPPLEPRADNCLVVAEFPEDSIDAQGKVHHVAASSQGMTHPRERGCSGDPADQPGDRSADDTSTNNRAETMPGDGETLAQVGGKGGASVRVGIRGLGPPDPCAATCRAGTSQLVPACNGRCIQTITRLTPGATPVRETRQ